MASTQTKTPSKHRLPGGIDAVLRQGCINDFFYFVQVFWDVVIQEEPVYNWHIPYLCDELEEAVRKVAAREIKEEDILINIPPGTTKSTIASVMLPVWAWVIDASLRTMNASYSGTVSTDHSVKSRDIVQSDRFKRLFPEVQIKEDENTKTKWKNTSGGERIATSVTGTATGFHSHILIVDDPLNPKEAASDADRARAAEFMDTTLSTRKVDKDVTLTILVMQRLHAQDPTGNWLQKKEKPVKHICLPGEISKDVYPPELAQKYVDGLLDPKRLSKKALAELKVDLGSYGYAGQVMQTPAPADGAIWKKHYLRAIPDKEIDRVLYLWTRQISGEIPASEATIDIRGYGHDWDLAYTKKEKNSASAYVTSFKMGESMYVDKFDWQWLEFPELINWMKSVPGGAHYIEAKASGKSATQTLVRSGIAAIEVQVKGAEGDKIGRANLATPYAEAGLVYVRQSILERLLSDVQQGLLLFPNTGTDLNDALVQAINRHLAAKDFFVV